MVTAKRKEYLQRYYQNVTKLKKDPKPPAPYDNLAYRSVGKEWRTYVAPKAKTQPKEIESPVIHDLLCGKTLLVDWQAPINGERHPFINLYPYFANRGFKLHANIADDVANNRFRRLLVWLEPLPSGRFLKEDEERVA